MCPNPGVVFPRHYAVGRVLQEGIDLQQGGVSTLRPLCARVHLLRRLLGRRARGVAGFLEAELRFGIYGKVGQRLQSRSRRLWPFGKCVWPQRGFCKPHCEQSLL